MKNPLTPSGIKPATFRFVAQYLNHCATAVPLLPEVQHNICAHGSTVVKVVRYKSEGHWFKSRWCHWNFAMT